MQLIALLRPKWIGRAVPIWLLGLSVVFSLTSMLSGQEAAVAALGKNGLSATVKALILQHEDFATFTVWTSLALLIGWLFLYLRFPDDRRVDLLAGAFLILLSAAVLFTGYLGGVLVMRYGVGVGQL